LTLHFQPIVDLRSGECRRAEALVRWLHPRVGSIGARWIVELAEREGILPALMRWAIARAERQRAEWALAGLEIAPSINLAGVEIDDDALAIRAALHDCAARPSGYTFDVPASIQADRNVALERLRALGRTGARVALDGVEESDLPSRTAAMHLDEIKSARSLIRRAASDGMAAAGVRRIIEAARDRGLVTVAIGVEDAATARFLRAAGCDLAQGFYMSRPLANAEVARWHGWMARIALSGTAAVSGYLGPMRPASDAPPVTRAASMPLAGPSCCVLPATATPRDLGIALVTFDAGGSAVVAEASLAKADVARVTDAVSRDVIAIQRSLGVPFSHAPTVYVLATRASFAFALQRGFGQPATGAGALASSNGGVAFPSEGALLINYENVKGDASLAIVRHELAHLLAHQIAGPDADRRFRPSLRRGDGWIGHGLHERVPGAFRRGARRPAARAGPERRCGEVGRRRSWREREGAGDDRRPELPPRVRGHSGSRRHVLGDVRRHREPRRLHDHSGRSIGKCE